MLNVNDEVFLNQVVQGHASRETAAAWFGELLKERQRAVLAWLAIAIEEARGTNDDVQSGVEWAGLRPRHSAVVLLSRGPLRIQLAKVRALRSEEWGRAFLLLLGMLRVADARRRSLCGEDCRHWWHRDLSDPKVVRRVVEERS